jgi:hypothetical protein
LSLAAAINVAANQRASALSQFSPPIQHRQSIAGKEFDFPIIKFLGGVAFSSLCIRLPFFDAFPKNITLLGTVCFRDLGKLNLPMVVRLYARANF